MISKAVNERKRPCAVACGLLLAVFFLISGWVGALALWYRLPVTGTLFGILWFIYNAGILWASLCGPTRRAALLYIPGLLLLLLWWSSITPRADRDWSPDVSRLAVGERNDDIVTLHNVRDFKWYSPADFDADWKTRKYNLDDIKGVDLFLSYWGMPAIAHTLVGFEFGDGSHVVFSVEIRKEKGEVFSNIAGFFKQYELALIAADERDIIYYRTNITGQDVYRYRITTAPEGRKKLFLSYLAMGQRLAQQPEFYNTLTGNCTTTVFHMGQTIRPDLRMDPRIVLSGYLPGYLHEKDPLYKNQSLAQMKEAAKISEKAMAAGYVPDFSQKIRSGK